MYLLATKSVSVSRVSSQNSRVIHDKRVPNIMTSQYHLILSHFFVFSSEWATLQAHNFKAIAYF